MSLLTQCVLVLSLASYGLTGGVGPITGSRPVVGAGGATRGIPGIGGPGFSQVPIGVGMSGIGSFAPGVQGNQVGLGGVSGTSTPGVQRVPSGFGIDAASGISGSRISQIPIGLGGIGTGSSGVQGVQSGFPGISGSGVQAGLGVTGRGIPSTRTQGVPSGLGGIPGISGSGVFQVPGGLGGIGSTTSRLDPGVSGISGSGVPQVSVGLGSQTPGIQGFGLPGGVGGPVGVGGRSIVPGGVTPISGGVGGIPITSGPGGVGSGAPGTRGVGARLPGRTTVPTGGVSGAFGSRAVSGGVSSGLGGIGATLPGGVGGIGGTFPTGQGEAASPEPYSMGYQNQDELGNIDFRSEQGDAYGNVQGSYGYADIQGLYRLVEYNSGANGFMAVVHTNEPGTEAQNPSYVSMNVQQPPVGVQEQYTPVTGAAGLVTGGPYIVGPGRTIGVGNVIPSPYGGISQFVGTGVVPSGGIGSTSPIGSRPFGAQLPTSSIPGIVGTSNLGTNLGGRSLPTGVDGFPALSIGSIPRGGQGVRSGKSGY